ncbi:hypothetical protein K443DRAFT_684243 [Laccaria amethystina LaAM-08-1]|uniref:Uncharacterized protein n=1 Tax=Laccaria amethystina LaAM-08-1 TaxID=1095629 RepID=A0A0C9WR16_9AGAR|nr:hypothetical protein K443DRAFT_684243 [Laccaria amethystina LaAM-08-1]
MSLTHQKSLFLVGHQPSDGALAMQDQDLRQSFLPSVPVSGVQMFNYLGDGEIDRTEKDRDKGLNRRRERNINRQHGCI